MDEILERYKQGKFQKCLELIKLLPPGEELADNFVIENCSLVCSSIIAILENDTEKMSTAEESLYLFYENVTSVGLLPDSLPLHLKLTFIYNFYWWILFVSDKKLQEEECEEYLTVINMGLYRVLGKNETNEAAYLNLPEKIMENLLSLIKFTSKKTTDNIFLAIEISVVVLMFIAIVRNDCLKMCATVSKRVQLHLKEENLLENCETMKFLSADFLPSHLFKFSLKKIASTLEELDDSVINHMQLLESVFHFLQDNYRDSLKCLQMSLNATFSDLSHYLAAVNCFNLNKKNLCSGYVRKISLSNVSNDLKVRLLILNGKLCSSGGKHKEAVKCFNDALNLLQFPLPIFYLGHEWGKMGLYDLMVDHFENLLKVLESYSRGENNYNFISLVLNLIHPDDEITIDEALYALAISYGLNERFHDAATTFDRYFHSVGYFKSKPTSERIVKIPDGVTVLHDAAITNILAGNSSRAEDIALMAVDRYSPRRYSSSDELQTQTSLMDKDVDWLRRTIELELLESDVEDSGTENKVYPEDMIYVLSENAIALLILSEVQKIHGSDEYGTTLRKIFTCLSVYFGNLTRKQVLSTEEMEISVLAKALASKICLKIAQMQIRTGKDANVEKMFKRSISCNKGDRDALYFYCKFLVSAGRRREAGTLWRSFRYEEPTVKPETVQSLSLRYFLTDQVTSRQLEKIQRELVFDD